LYKNISKLKIRQVVYSLFNGPGWMQSAAFALSNDFFQDDDKSQSIHKGIVSPMSFAKDRGADPKSTKAEKYMRTCILLFFDLHDYQKIFSSISCTILPRAS
jgi:hypothetical protein